MLEKSPLIHPFFHQGETRKKKRVVGWIIFIIFLFLAGGLGLWYFWPKEDNLPGPNIFQLTREVKEAVSLAPSFLGYDRPKTYLALFLNNAEMRPGGGFIGSYAWLKLDKGRLVGFETSGSENLDWAAPDDFKVEPPLAIKTYLRQPRWFFRDANWSPDFPTSARAALWFYRFEGGRDGAKINGVIALTPTVVEKLVKLTGPLEVGGKVYQPENIIDELQYNVEFGYREEGKERAERKILVGDLGRALLQKLAGLSPWKWKDVYFLVQQMFKERQLMVWSPDEAIQQAFLKEDWAGEVKKTAGDYLLAVDANLGSLKSDPKVEREINYQIRPEGGRLRAKVNVIYNHRGQFDWKTTRYRTYTRVYVPQGSRLIRAEGFIQDDKIKKGEKPLPALPVITEELGKTVFGGFMSIEPGASHLLTLEYYLPDKMVEQAKKGEYNLLVQKQLGASAYPLTLDLDFGKTIERKEDGKFYQKTDLKVDFYVYQKNWH